MVSDVYRRNGAAGVLLGNSACFDFRQREMFNAGYRRVSQRALGRDFSRSGLGGVGRDNRMGVDVAANTVGVPVHHGRRRASENSARQRQN